MEEEEVLYEEIQCEDAEYLLGCLWIFGPNLPRKRLIRLAKKVLKLGFYVPSPYSHSLKNQLQSSRKTSKRYAGC